MAQGAVEYAKELGCPNPQIVLHLDHGDSFELCKDCVDMGFSSVMIDGSHLPYDENVALTKKVVDYAHQYDVTVEGELGVLAGVEDEVVAEHHTYTRPEEVVDFVTKTGCDSLAISIGTSHGAYKFKPEQCHVDPATGRLVPPPLAFDVLDGVMKELPGFPIVLHGSSSVPQEDVDTINQYGGKLEAAIGIPEDELRKAAKSAVCKINIDSDSRLAMTAAIRKVERGRWLFVKTGTYVEGLVGNVAKREWRWELCGTKKGAPRVGRTHSMKTMTTCGEEGLFLAAVGQLLDSTVGRVEGDLRGGFLVEKHIAQDFHLSELSHGEFAFAEFLVGVEYAHFHAFGHVVVDPFVHLAFLFSLPSHPLRVAGWCSCF